MVYIHEKSAIVIANYNFIENISNKKFLKIYYVKYVF